MSDRIPPDNNNTQQEEGKYLTLADKQPSLISGNISARSISTRELSTNLQTTRDGLMQLMRERGEGNERIRATRGSDSGTDDDDDINGFQNFGMPVRSAGRAGNAQYFRGMDGVSSIELTNDGGKLDKNAASNIFSSKTVQQGKSRLNGEGNDEDYYVFDEIHKGGNGQNDELFSSQNPKKDGPLHTRIFIDAFIPSLEGNRIFPLFNYRCAEKLGRLSKDFYEKKRKLSANLLPVTDEDQSPVGENNVQQEESNRNLRTFEVDQTKEDIPQPKARKSWNVHESRELHKVEKIQEMLQLQSVERIQQEERKKEIQPTLSTNKSDHPTTEENQLVVKSSQFHEENTDQTENAGKVEQDVSQIQLSEQEDVPPVIATDPKQEQTVSQTESSDQDKLKSEVKMEQDVNQMKVSGQEEVAPSLATKLKVEENVSPINVETPTEEEEKLLLKLTRALLANEELIDIFCEKLISKIAARNDFCGPDCKSTCGGLNKNLPSGGNNA